MTDETFDGKTGLQMAGGHLKELQRAFKNPMANLGMIMDEVTKRGFKAVGLSGSSALNDLVAPQLRPSASLAVKGVDNFGASVEHLLKTYNKNIIHEQFLLSRLANSAIDIFIQMVVLSRATRAINRNHLSAGHEVNMASVICSEVCILSSCHYLPHFLFPDYFSTIIEILSLLLTADVPQNI